MDKYSDWPTGGYFLICYLCLCYVVVKIDLSEIIFYVWHYSKKIHLLTCLQLWEPFMFQVIWCIKAEVWHFGVRDIMWPDQNFSPTKAYSENEVVQVKHRKTRTFMLQNFAVTTMTPHKSALDPSSTNIWNYISVVHINTTKIRDVTSRCDISSCSTKSSLETVQYPQYFQTQ